MSVLGDVRIREAIERGEIKISPMHPDAVGSNSVDLHLGRHLAVYNHLALQREFGCLDTRQQGGEEVVRRFEIPSDGFVFLPGELYLGATVEWTRSGPYLPMIEGTSSAGRLGLSVHSTAGVGDVGFIGHFTLELSVVRPLRVYGGEPVAQVLFHTVEGRVDVPYGRKVGRNYQDQGPLPQPSRMWLKPRFLG